MFREDEGVQTAIVVFESEHMHNVLKAEFMAVWVPAYLEAFNKSTVFQGNGCCTFQPQLHHGGPDKAKPCDIDASGILNAATKPGPCDHECHACAAADTFRLVPIECGKHFEAAANAVPVMWEG
jgi:hypothetical protein